GIAVTDQWKLGRKKEDKGLLILIAPKERKMRIEVGYGLEGELTDAFTRQVQDDVMRPLFRDGRYYDGILASLGAIQEKVPLGLDANQIPSAAEERGSDHGRKLHVLLTLLFLCFFVFMPLLNLLNRINGGGRYRRGPWDGGGGWGGGGG